MSPRSFHLPLFVHNVALSPQYFNWVYLESVQLVNSYAQLLGDLLLPLSRQQLRALLYLGLEGVFGFDLLDLHLLPELQLLANELQSVNIKGVEIPLEATDIIRMNAHLAALAHKTNGLIALIMGSLCASCVTWIKHSLCIDQAHNHLHEEPEILRVDDLVLLALQDSPEVIQECSLRTLRLH